MSKPGELFFWPLMAMHFAFNVEHLFDRSLCCQAINNAATVEDAYMAFHKYRDELKKAKKIKDKEPLPLFDNSGFDGGCF